MTQYVSIHGSNRLTRRELGALLRLVRHSVDWGDALPRVFSEGRRDAGAALRGQHKLERALEKHLTRPASKRRVGQAKTP